VNVELLSLVLKVVHHKDAPSGIDNCFVGCKKYVLKRVRIDSIHKRRFQYQFLLHGDNFSRNLYCLRQEKDYIYIYQAIKGSIVTSFQNYEE